MDAQLFQNFRSRNTAAVDNVEIVFFWHFLFFLRCTALFHGYNRTRSLFYFSVVSDQNLKFSDVVLLDITKYKPYVHLDYVVCS